MTQSVVLASGTRFKTLSGLIVELSGTGTFIFPANDLDGVAEMLAAMSKEDPLMASNLRLNIGVLGREVIAPAGGLGGYDVGTALQVTYGPQGERIYTSNGAPPIIVPAGTTVVNATPTKITLKFDQNIVSPGANYLLGFSAKVATVARTISSAIRGAVDLATVELTLASGVTTGQAVVVSYNIATGDIESAAGAELQSFIDQVVVNTV